jgi:hypothetical protein
MCVCVCGVSQDQDLQELHGEEGLQAAPGLSRGPLRRAVHRCVLCCAGCHAPSGCMTQTPQPVMQSLSVCGLACLFMTPTPPNAAVKGSDCVVFLDWEEGTLIRRIDVLPKNIYWNESGEIVLLACDESYFVLRYNKVRACVGGSCGPAPPRRHRRTARPPPTHIHTQSISTPSPTTFKADVCLCVCVCVSVSGSGGGGCGHGAGGRRGHRGRL